MAALVRLTAPDGAESFLCYDWPGTTPDRDKATRFATAGVAWRAGQSAVYGDRHAFWNSERASAEATRSRMAGYAFAIEQA